MSKRKTIEDIPKVTNEEQMKYIKECEEGLKETQKQPNKGFDLEEIENMTSDELKEYNIDKEKAIKYLKQEELN